MSKSFGSIKILLLLCLLVIPSTGNAGLFDMGKKKTKVEVGAQAPNFEGTTFRTGEKVSYEKDLKGKKVVLLDFWSIYCVSCLKEIPKVMEIQEKYKDKDVAFLYINLDTNKRRLKMFLKKNNFAPIVMDKTRTIANLFNVNILPTTLIIGKDGKIKFFHEGYKAGDERAVEEVIKKLTD